MTLLGEVEKTDKEEVKVNLRIDKGKKGLYPYPFRPETGNMLYNMPQKGTTVSLYMTNHDERQAMIQVITCNLQAKEYLSSSTIKNMTKKKNQRDKIQTSNTNNMRYSLKAM